VASTRGSSRPAMCGWAMRSVRSRPSFDISALDVNRVRDARSPIRKLFPRRKDRAMSESRFDLVGLVKRLLHKPRKPARPARVSHPYHAVSIRLGTSARRAALPREGGAAPAAREVRCAQLHVRVRSLRGPSSRGAPRRGLRQEIAAVRGPQRAQRRPAPALGPRDDVRQSVLRARRPARRRRRQDLTQPDSGKQSASTRATCTAARAAPSRI